MKTIILTLSVVFSFSLLAEQNVLDCDGNDQEHYNLMQGAYDKEPNVENTYSLGYSSICQGYIKKGVDLFEQASDGGHPTASYLLGRYFLKDKTFDNNMEDTWDVDNFNAMRFYLDLAVQQINSNPSYPNNTFRGIPYNEKNSFTSAKAFALSAKSYYNGYIMAMMDVLNNREIEHTNDTSLVLNNMKQKSEQCLERSPLAIWGDNQSYVYNWMQSNCQAFKQFADNALPLEEKRTQVESTCETPIKECEAHKKIVGELVALSNIMASNLDLIL